MSSNVMKGMAWTAAFFLFLSYNAPHIPNQVPLTYEQEYTEKGLRRNYAVRRGPWKLVGGKELFDLSRDPYERKNLAERQPGRVNELQEAFDRWSYFC